MHWHIAKNVLTRKRCIYSSFTHAFIRSLSISNFPSIRYYRVAVLRLHCIRRICERERYFIHIMCWLSGYKFSSSESFDRTCVWVSHNSISTLQFGNFFFVQSVFESDIHVNTWMVYRTIINVEFIESTPYHLFFPLRDLRLLVAIFLLLLLCFGISISINFKFSLQRRLHGFFKFFTKRTHK